MTSLICISHLSSITNKFVATILPKDAVELNELDRLPVKVRSPPMIIEFSTELTANLSTFRFIILLKINHQHLL